jgi:hypothetical protein
MDQHAGSIFKHGLENPKIRSMTVLRSTTPAQAKSPAG